MVWRFVGRLAFRRSLKSHVLSNHKERIEINIISEFDGEISIIEQSELSLAVVDANTKEIISTSTAFSSSSSSSSTSISSPSSPSSSPSPPSNMIVFTILTPTRCGSYQYLVTVIKSPEDYLILPLLSSVFEIVADEIPSNWKILCKTYRPLRNSSSEILIQEDRGLTMGSHLWDSSIILFLNFHVIIQPHLDHILQQKSNLIAVELGAGCSLLGMSIAQYLIGTSYHVYCTDLKSQLPLIMENIALNNLDTLQQISGVELDWSSQSNINTFITSSLDGHDIDLLIAADVLYQSDMTTHFFHTLSCLAKPEHTVILIAQKIRSNSQGVTSIDLIDLRTYQQFHSSIVHEEADVIIWQLIVKKIIT